MKHLLKYTYLLFVCMLMASCKIENLSDVINIPKTNFDTYNYVLATEDASDVDITTFFAFDMKNTAPGQKYDLFGAGDLFINSNPSTSSGQLSFRQYFFSQAKDKKGYSSTPGLYRLTLNDQNRVYIDNELNISRDNLFPARQLCIVNDHLGYFYNEGKEAHSIQIFDPSEMMLTGSINLEPAIRSFRPGARWVDDAGNNLIRTGSLVLEESGGKLYVSVVFLEMAEFNLIADDEHNFYLAVIDIQTNTIEKIITYEGAKTVGFFVSENKATTVDEDGAIYFCSWGWNQFNQPFPSKVFRIRQGETEFDKDWVIDIEKHFGKGRIAQSIISFNHKIYLHISAGAYGFSEDDAESAQMHYYEFDPERPDEPEKLDIPGSNTSSRMSVFSEVDGRLYVCVPNLKQGEFNGLYAVDKSGDVTKVLTIENKFRPTRIYKLGD